MAVENTSPPVSGNSRRKSQQFFRLFSTESTRSSNCAYGDISVRPEWNHSFQSKEFVLKLAQILVSIICTGLYSNGIHAINNSITTVMFPNVVLSAFIIITSVIIISYILGHVMPEVLIRIFNSLGAILFFVSGAITGQYWLVQGRFEAENDDKNEDLYMKINMLLVETVLSFFNAFLYGADVYLSIKTTLKNLELPPEVVDSKRQSTV